MGKIITPNGSLWMIAINNMVKRGDLTVEQYNKIYEKINNGRRKRKEH